MSRLDVTAAIDDDAVLLRDVGPRDGLQSIDAEVSIETKVAMVQGLVAAGLRRVEVGSFVSPTAVPRMADSGDVFAATAGLGKTSREALVVNERGAHAAVAAGADVLVSVVSVSETFSRRNVGMSTHQAIAEMAAVCAVAAEASLPVSINLSASFGCAFEGPIEPTAVADVAEALAELGPTELLLADTIGAAAPSDVRAVVAAVRERTGDGTHLGLHLHDTRGLALANAAAGLDAGIRRFDASVGGLGGCPFSPGATGNVCTEDLVHLFHAEGLSTGIDLDELIAVASTIESALDRTLPSRMLRAGPRFRDRTEPSFR
ncbi:MAG: hydroxymethylglutaryl-CoA lyase [Ilumatobacter sp.]|uniref:hydroxymethylglutaryl-CoA lyase n=1 Tax=Ilumatobacter sp. TaxID=1967498 RepID=UPI003299C531